MPVEFQGATRFFGHVWHPIFGDLHLVSLALFPLAGTAMERDP